MNKQVIRLTEADIQRIVESCTRQVLNEEYDEGFLGNMIRGYRQGRQDYKAAQQPYKDATRTARQDSRQANQLARKYGRFIDKDLATIEGILSRYEEYSQIGNSARMIKGALSNLKKQINANAEQAQAKYNTARSNQASNKEMLDTNMQQGVRNAFSGNAGAQQQYGNVG